MKEFPKATGSSHEKVQSDTGTKPKPVFKMDLFRAAVAAKIWECQPNPDFPAYDPNGAEVEQAIEKFTANFGKAPDEYNNAVEAASVFSEWVDVNGFEYERPVYYKSTGYSITLSAQTKSGTVSMTMQFVSTEDDDKAVAQARQDLVKRFASAFPVPEASKIQGTAKPGAKTEYKTEEVDIECLRVGIYNGKMVYHIIPSEGKWTQFGIPLYPDIAKKFDLDLPDEEGEYELSGTMTYELKDDGKPRRVISIV